MQICAVVTYISLHTRLQMWASTFMQTKHFLAPTSDFIIEELISDVTQR